MVISPQEGFRFCTHVMGNEIIMFVDSRRTRIKIQRILMVARIEILLD